MRGEDFGGDFAVVPGKFPLANAGFEGKKDDSMIIFYGMLLAASLLFCGVLVFAYLVKG